MRACTEASRRKGRLRCDKTHTSLAANRTRESRLSGMRGGLAETCTMGELGTRCTTERVHVGNSPPKVARTALLPDGDGFQRPLVPRSRFQPRLTRGVRSRSRAYRSGGRSKIMDETTQTPL